MFYAGVYADRGRETGCVSGPPGSEFDMYAWGWTPPDEGLTYATLRFDFPDNLDMSARAVFNELVTDVIVVDYDDGTAEWTMLIAECPSGWIELFRQRTVIIDDSISEVSIAADHSMMRDCGFVLNDITVSGPLVINDPECAFVAAGTASWGAVKSILRQRRR